MARRTTVAEAPFDRLRIGRHQLELRPIVQRRRLIGGGASGFSAGIRIYVTLTANSIEGSQRWNWHRPERCQFLATEVSRDFIPPCPVRISPAQAAALGPAIKLDAEP